MAALDGAVPLPQVHQVAVGVAEHLHFDVFRARDVALDEDLVAAKCGGRLALGLGQLVGELVGSITTRMPRPPPPKLALMMSG